MTEPLMEACQLRGMTVSDTVSLLPLNYDGLKGRISTA